ncbi:Crp/Fnr family transcriptional regulator [Bizionia arctica]|nr:Crp/Fnr family transcriptional regulator [Bizionia arctica]
MKTTAINYSVCLTQLENHKLFKHLNNEAVISLLENCKYTTWQKGTEFFEGDNSSNNFYIILSGRIKTYKTNFDTDRNYTLSLLGKGDVVDIMALIDGKKHNINFTTIDEVEVLYTSMTNMRHWMEKYPAVYKTFMPYMSSQMRVMEVNLTDNILADIPTRLARLFVSNCNESKHLEKINDLSHDEIANMIGSTRAVVNRHIQQFKRNGIISVQRKQTTILNYQLLTQHVDAF